MSIILIILYVTFMFNWQKQVYASHHFTGAWQPMIGILSIFAIVGRLFNLYILIRYGLNTSSVIKPVILFVIGIIGWFLLSTIFNAIIRIKETSNMTDNAKSSNHMRTSIILYRMDVFSTSVGVIAMIINPVLGIILLNLIR